MHSVQVGMWDPRPPSKHGSPLASPCPSDVRLAHVTTACPAKRITFYKSGDSQFGGVKMAVHKRSFKCFDALLDDLSQKVPLPFGVRTVTTPRGTNTIRHLEQLQDGGCYLCSDRRQAKPINMELASKRPSIWYHQNRRPQRPESSSTTPPNHLPYRQRRILLVKNSEPGMRRSVVLSRRSTRSLGAFLDEVSELMQFHVRKLYTAEGRKIDSVQSLMTCPPVLVCVGREAFSPMLANFIKKNSEEKLPGLDSRSPGLGPRTPGNGARSPAVQGARSPPHGAQSRASEYSEGHESKKNVNFGLETKKSIIHPRSDSSNRSNHFSMSSEKSYGNGVGAYSQARPAIMNDDIEKRVLVNKDGSLSVEMRVRFRLHNDETVQWSTQIKKSPSLTNDCCPLSQVQAHYLHNGQSESCSDPDSMSFDPEVVEYSSRPVQRALEANHCPCCYQRPEQHYDLWENPAHSHKQPLVPPPHPHTSSHTRRRHTNSSSSSSSCNSRRVVHCRAQHSSCGGGSGSEQSQLIQEEMCVTEQVEHTVEVEQDGDKHIEVCRVSRCHSRSEVVTRDSNLRPLSSKSGEEEVMIEEEQERPQSAVSCSSHVLQSLKEDQDDEEEDLPPSASRCHHSDEPSPSPSSKTSTVKNHRDGEERASSAVSAASSCCCGSVTQLPTAEAEEMDRAPSSKSKVSRASCRSGRTGLSTGSKKSGASSMCPNCGGCKREATSNPASPQQKQENGANDSNDDASEDSAVSTQSNKSNLTNSGRSSAESSVLEGRASSAVSRASNPEVKEEERAPSAISATSHRSNRSHRSGSNGATGITVDKEEGRSLSAMSARSRKSETPDTRTREEAEEENVGERAISSLSVKSGVSAKTGTSVKSHKSNCPLQSNAASPTDNTAIEEDETHKISPSSLSERPHSALSAKSNVTAKSSTSHRSACSRCAKVKSPGAEEATRQEAGTDGQNRTASAMSAKSNLSVKSNNSHKSTKASERSLSPRSEAQGEERPASQTSARSVKSTNVSVKSSKSRKSNCDENETEASPSSKVEEEAEEKDDEMVEEETQHEPERAASARSTKSHRSKMSNENTGDDENAKERTASVLSGKSALSAKSHHSKTDVDRSPSSTSGKSKKSKCSAASPDGDEQPTETEERVASAMSVKSKSSARSHLKSASPGPNAVTINSPEEVDEEGSETTERAPSAASAKSGKSHVSSNHKGRKAPAAPGSRQSSAQQLVPGPGAGETRGPSALSVRSATSAKSGKSKCRCGAASGEDKKEGNNEEATERAASVLSSSSKRQRRDSGGTEQPLSRCSSGSVSLGLPEDQETADSDSGKSCVSFCTNTESKGRGKTAASEGPKTQRGSAAKKDVEGRASKNKSTLSHNPPAVDIPTIETPGGGDGRDEEEGGGQKAERAASAISAKSGRSHKSSCSCSSKVTEQQAGNNLQTESDSKTKNLNAHNNRTSSSMSSSSAKVRTKSRASANVAKTPVGDSSGNDTGNISEVKEQEDAAASVHSKSLCCLRPESAASAQSGSKTTVKSVKGRESRSKAGSNGGDPCPLHDSRPGSKVESETTLSHSLSAADLLKETMAARPLRPESKASKTSDRTGGEKSAKSQRKKNQKDKNPELTPACLPNASPNEVVNNWLRSIPANSSMLALGDELEEGEQEAEEKPGEEEVAQVEESPEDDKVEEEEERTEAEEGAEKEEEAKCDTAEEEQNSDPAPADETVTSSPTRLLSADSLPRNLHPSVAVMKVLLSSSLGRCRSLPEVSPVYGRRLSTSARGFLDCLAQLQLIEPALSPGCDLQKNPNQQYEEIMTILQSLWLTGPTDTEVKKGKDIGKEQVTPPRSSSGVGMSSGSGGSGKENGNKDGHETPPKETESLPEVQVQSEDQSTLPPSLDSPKATENPSSSDKSSANDSSKSPTDNEQETVDDSSSGTPSTVLRTPLSKKLSQDPDPVWVLHLLKKLEKQFINHYINAMAEFKVRWDLDDSLMLDTMISELKEEVSRRIQSSIEREIRKIKGRAGRGGRSPRPPQGANLSRESTVTEKRRRILKVMKNQSVKTTDSVSDGEMEGDFSDQRSDDEYCPCDACVLKKLAARPLKANPLAADAPVMMEFDLLKILQRKKSPEPAPVAVHQSVDVEGEEGRNLEVVQEEEEEEEEEKTKEDIKAEVVLEEMIPEEDEEEGEGQTEEEEKVEKEENSEDGKEQEEGEKEGEVAGEEGASGNGEEEEEEAEGQTEEGEKVEKEENSEDGKEQEEEEKEGEVAVEEGASGNGEEEEEGEGQTEEEEKVEKEENSEDGKEQEEGEKEGEGTGEEGPSGNGEEEEEEEGEAECQCQCARNEEESDKAEEEEEAEETGDNTGEDEAADDEGDNEDETGTGEEDSDMETVKEAPVGKGETTEGQEEEEGEEEECEASDSKPEEEETTGKESGEEEAEDEDDGDDGGGEEESHEEGEGGESEEQEGAPPQDQGATEGEEADAEDSDTDKKSPSDTSVDEVVAGTTGDEEEKEAGGGGDAEEEEVGEDAVEEFKPEEEEEEEEVNGSRKEEGALLHQFTRTSVESQPGSLEDIHTDSAPVSTIEVPKMVSTGGGASPKRSRSPGRVKRRKPKDRDTDLDDY